MDIGKLKVVKRLGWILGGTREEETESIADHSFRLAVMAWILGYGRADLDMTRVLKMAVMHDFPVVNAGDITPYDDYVTKGQADAERLSRWPRRSQEEKEKLAVSRRKKEKAALVRLTKDLPHELQTEMEELWREYEYGTSKEGHFVRQVDRIEKLIQSIEYKEAEKYHPRIDPYWTQLKELLDEPELIQFVETLDSFFYGNKKYAKMNRLKSR